MAWRSQKSALRKRLNSRWLRWVLWRGLFRVLPALGRRYSFPLHSVAAIDVAAEIIANGAGPLSGGFTDAQMREVVLPAVANDKMRQAHAPGTCRAVRQIAVVEDCALLGHVSTLIRRSDGAMLYHCAGSAPNWNFAKPGRLRSRRCEGLATSLHDGQHYYHFFERVLGLIGYLDHEHRPGSALTLLTRAGGPAFQRETCAAIAAAYPGLSVREVGEDERAEIDRYLWLHDVADNTEWLPATRERADRLAGILRAHYRQGAPCVGELLFFSRGAARKRRLKNEAELEAIAAARGFARFTAVTANHPEQVRRFANADVIVGVHGAGFTNLLFAQAGAAVIELFPSNCVKSTYLWLSNRVNLRHYPLLGTQGDSQQAFDVAPDLFAARLDEVLAQRAQNRLTA